MPVNFNGIIHLIITTGIIQKDTKILYHLMASFPNAWPLDYKSRFQTKRAPDETAFAHGILPF